MVDLNLLLLGLGLSQLVFLGSYLYISYRQQYLARRLRFIAACLAGFLLGQIPVLDAIPAIDLMLASLAILTPAALWLFSLAFFNDESEIPRYGLALIAGYFLLRTGASTLDSLGQETGQLGYLLGYLVPLIVMLGLSMHVIFLGIVGRNDDLLEERRKLRIPFVIGLGIVIVFTLAIGTVFPLLMTLLPAIFTTSLLATVALSINAAVFLWALVLNLAIVRYGEESGTLLNNAPSQGPDGLPVIAGLRTSEKERRLLENLRQAMEEQRLFRNAGMTISQLCREIGVPEHRLRTTINQTMGFRNFSQFLNGYRIREATRLLTHSEEPIANIAMEVGYNSLSSFNKAFKEIHGRTPREHRAGTQASGFAEEA